VVQGYSPAVGGTERLIQRISEKLVASYSDKVTVFTTTAYNCELFWRRDQPQLPAGTETINGVTVRRFPVFNRLNTARRLLAGITYKLSLPYNDWFRAFYNGPLINGMTRAIAESGADLVAGSSFPLLHMHYLQRGGQRAGIPVVFYGGIHIGDAYGFDRRMIYRAIQRADAYIAFTSFERDHLVGRGIPRGKITVTGVGVDVETFSDADGSLVRARFGWHDAPVVAFVGQQVPHKGIDMVLEAMKQIWMQSPDVCLLVAGARTTYSTFIEHWIGQLPAEWRTRIGVIDNFDEAEKPGIFAASDVLVFPSGHESFGIVFLEAWAAGKPVIGARFGAIPSVVEHGLDGLLIEHRNLDELVSAIRILLTRPEMRQELGAAGLRKVKQRYTWDIVAAQCRDVYIGARNKSFGL
jgi:glycosyltransferase involved in cell wall biosynthesis